LKRAVIYARYSSDNQREESISAQVFYECKQYAKKNELVIVGTYIDEAISATTDVRPNFLRMFDEAKSGIFEYVLIHKLDRFSRNRFDSAIYKKRLRELGIKLISITQPFDDSPESAILEAVLEGMDEFYSKNLSREVMKGMRENARKCLHNGGIPPLGYDVANKKYVINEPEALVVRLIFDLYTKGYGYDRINNELNRLGYRNKLGNPFSKHTLSSILRNEKYNGVYIFNRAVQKINGKRNNHKNKSDEEIIRIPMGIPRIVDEVTFIKAQEIIVTRRHPGERSRMKAKTNYLLSGKVICGKCGCVMVGNTINSKKPYAYYECNYRDRTKNCASRRINKVMLEELVLEILKDNIFRDIPGLIQEVNQLHKKRDEHTANNINSLQLKIKELKSKNHNLIKAIEEGGFSKFLHEQLVKNEDIEKELVNELNKMLVIQNSKHISNEMLIVMLENARDKIFDYKDEMETKNLINMFVNQVTVYENEIKVSINMILDTNGGGEGTCTPVSKGNHKSIYVCSFHF